MKKLSLIMSLFFMLSCGSVQLIGIDGFGNICNELAISL